MAQKKSKTAKKIAKAIDDNRPAMEATTDFIKDNAVPLTMVAVGAGLLAARTIANGDNAVNHAADQATDGLTRAGHRAEEVSREAARIARDRADALTDTIREHPVMSGIAALAIGAGVAAISMQRADRHIGR
ncbi:hypothetical protein [Pseudokordiimonas caeni]|uniref:hypothetical protein n=1 Tax=Pseudokordiimonas caeni TaxID=2997908 RepID=UPI00281284AF|nr:hypothetical protein [Pseudokordiimonas caeni]